MSAINLFNSESERVLADLQPKEVFKYFEEICRIPHGSGDTKRISDYCVNFAKEHNLRYIQDTSNNVIIFKDGTQGYQQSEPVIIQGHLDMVCEKENDCDIDFSKDGLDLLLEGGYVTAKGTTLGGDDGIAVAFALAILASDTINHPPIEAVFTVDEEIGMLGAADIDCAPLKGRVMLNLDSEEEGSLLVSCAGGVTVTCHIDRTSEEQTEGYLFRLKVTGLIGGHSGVEIDKGRGNANQILGRVLYAMSKRMKFDIVAVNGGLKDNAIPREAYADILIPMQTGATNTDLSAEMDIEKLKKLCVEYNQILSREYQVTDSEVRIILEELSTENEGNITQDTENVTEKGKAIQGSKNVTEKGKQRESVCSQKVMTDAVKNRIITALVNLPGGVIKMSHDIEGLVETSLNMGILKTESQEITMSFSVRSSVQSEKEELVQKIECLMKSLGGTITTVGDYPAWEYRKDSKLRELMVEIYREQYGTEPTVDAIHAGVECGLFAGKLKGLDCVSFGPNILDIHTPKERLEIASVERTWNYVVEILRRLK